MEVERHGSIVFYAYRHVLGPIRTNVCTEIDNSMFVMPHCNASAALNVATYVIGQIQTPELR